MGINKIIEVLRTGLTDNTIINYDGENRIEIIIPDDISLIEAGHKLKKILKNHHSEISNNWNFAILYQDEVQQSSSARREVIQLLKENLKDYKVYKNMLLIIVESDTALNNKGFEILEKEIRSIVQDSDIKIDEDIQILLKYPIANHLFNITS